MGSLALTSSGLVYTDSQVLIYSVEKHPVYGPLLRPLWQAVQAGRLEVVSSELAILETLVGPLKKGDALLVTTYEQFCQQPGMRLLPITPAVLRVAAQWRASTSLRTPDAIHAAAGLQEGCVLFLTNDYGFRAVSGLPLVLLDDVLGSP